jgi:PilZ domain
MRIWRVASDVAAEREMTMSTLLGALKRAERTNPQSAGTGVDVVDAPSSPSRTSVGPTGVDKMPASAKTPLNTSQDRLERRTQKRVGVKLAARVRAADSRNGNFEEVLVTVNASRQSLFFITAREHYCLGMRLRVRFPYNSAHDCITASEDDGEVTRMERLPDKRVGVAVQLRGPANTASSVACMAGNSVSGGSARERRLADRHPFSAAAVIVDSHASMRLKARCSDLSLGGCYLDTINPFSGGTLAHLELRTADTVFQVVARVTFSHTGMGMGLGFQDLTPEQTSVLVNWLGNRDSGRLWVAERSEILNQAELLDRIHALKLVRQLISNGILTNADLSTLFTEPNPF